ncbi:Uncharacterised protein [uncultured archaeon]|nr:Uncharacterised protein [uncultured archaeon]
MKYGITHRIARKLDGIVKLKFNDLFPSRILNYMIMNDKMLEKRS